MKQQVWTISSLVKYLKNSLENDMMVQSILVKGEISNFTHHRSGHLYFSIKDSDSKMNCVMFSSFANKLKIVPKEGMKVIIQTKVSLYEPQGNLQLYVSAMQSDGVGDLYLQFEDVKKRLLLEGLFDEEHKKNIPLYPMRIGVVSAKTGAAIQDVLSIISRRWPLCDVQLYPSLVQGDNAAENMIENLLIADQGAHDIVLLVRGGGSIEDLWCFNSEALARTIYHMKTCIVSGVGHESDTTLVDYVCDYRAPTPSGAAEYVTPHIEELKQAIVQYRMRLLKHMQHRVGQHRSTIVHIQNTPIFKNSDYLIQNDKMRLMMAIKGLEHSKNRVYEQREWLNKQRNTLSLLSHSMQLQSRHSVQRLSSALFQTVQTVQSTNRKEMAKKASLLDAFSPLKTLQRGYSIALLNGCVIRRVEDVNIHDDIEVRVGDGSLCARIKEIK